MCCCKSEDVFDVLYPMPSRWWIFDAIESENLILYFHSEILLIYCTPPPYTSSITEIGDKYGNTLRGAHKQTLRSIRNSVMKDHMAKFIYTYIF